MAAPPQPIPTSHSPKAAKASDGDGEIKSRFDAYKGVKKAKGSGEMTPAQRSFIEGLVASYVSRTPSSKALTQKHRRVLADPRTANGFRSDWKEMVYPLVVGRSAGSKVWDVDGNVYVDLVNGYGPIAFGHSPDFVQKAIAEQLDSGFATGPQSPLAGEVAQLFAEMTGNERVTFCNTGSEAVMAALRLARTVTGRNKVVAFAGSYHGQFDEVIIHGRRAGAEPGAIAAAIGIPSESIANMIVLPYGSQDSLDYIRANADQLAAVLVETVQSRHPAYLPEAFIRELRDITAKSETALIFDEVVTGFRAHPAGMQGYLGIRADLATYGKVVGGGMPIGVLAGKAEFMDALDGGYWQYGDESSPEVAPTFFAGTFVRHPLVLAAVKAVLEHIKAGGEGLLNGLSGRTAALVSDINRAFSDRGIKVEVGTFSSFFFIDLGHAGPLASLFFPLMRLKGVHIQEGFPCYMTTAHDAADIAHIKDAIEATLDELMAVGILGEPKAEPLRVAREASGQSHVAGSHALEQVAPLTEAQREVWLAAQMSDAASCAFNESASLRLAGPLDVAALTLALGDVVNRHDALRASFGGTGERMRIAPSLQLPLEHVDLTGDADPEAALASIIDEDAATPFDLSAGPPVRALLAKLVPDVAVLVLTAHHIVCDGWSMNILLDELSQCYAARRQGRACDLAPAKSFLSYAREDATLGVADSAAEAFWLGQFETIPALPELPADRPRPERRSYRGGTFTAQIGAALTDQVRRASANQGCTLFATLFSAFQVLAGRLANQEDIVVAVPTAGQSLVDGGDSLVGHCVNFLPLRKPFAFEARFCDHLKAVSDYMLDAFDHQQYTLGTLVRKLNVRRDLNRLPLTELQFNLEKMGTGLAFDGLDASVAPNPKAFSNYDMFFNVIESKDGMRIDCDYNDDLYDAATIGRFIQRYEVILAAFVDTPQLTIAELPLADRSERELLLDRLNATEAGYPTDRCVHDLISEQAARTPDRIAVVFRDQKMTFAELEARANALAGRLARLVPGRGSRIAVGLDRSFDMIVALLAVMKSGHTYVPLDPDHPEDRLRLVIETARISGVVCDGDRIAKLAPQSAALIDLRQAAADAEEQGGAFVPVGGDPERGAYVIFTSGSTGVPKGVEVPHRAVVNFLTSMAKKPGFTQDDTIVAVTTISFDIAVLELYLPLITGGRVVIASKEDVTGGFGLAEIVQTSGATVLQATPSLWRMLLEARVQPRSGLKMLCGGEPLPRDLADALLVLGGELWNMYGPTETTVWSSVGQVLPSTDRITIGAPIDNTQLYVLDDRRQLCPIGLIGHLYIGGDGLATGYFDRPDLTDQAFAMISLDGRSEQRLYRTGDLAVRRADGTLELLGRIDHQVKLRGFRIELEDIETALRRQPGVAGAAAALRNGPDGLPRLVGYVVGEDGKSIDFAGLAIGLARTLPDYMVPSVWQNLQALPLTPNGKLDRKALPAVTHSSAAIAADPARALPETETERQIAAVWGEVLGMTEVGTRDSLFALGADSLQLFRIAARLADRRVPVEAKHLLQHPSIAELAAFVDARHAGEGERPAAVASLRDFRHGARRRGKTWQLPAERGGQASSISLPKQGRAKNWPAGPTRISRSFFVHARIHEAHSCRRGGENAGFRRAGVRHKCCGRRR
ncbi:MAG: amino acid adenylation domain-containing protein [Hyphomicrobiaceae bacterium]